VLLTTAENSAQFEEALRGSLPLLLLSSGVPIYEMTTA